MINLIRVKSEKGKSLDVFDKIQNVRAAERVAGEIGAIIRAGKYSEWSELPPLRYLMRRFGRNYGTIREALRILAEAGVIIDHKIY